MTLCGVLKNILLVAASVLIWGTIITLLQFLGYGIATAGLIYYGVGYEGIITCYTTSLQYATKLWEGESATSTTSRKTLLRKIAVIAMYTTILILLVTGISMKARQSDSLP